ncbi:MAG: AtpZ/AtpI family protein [Bacteroidota bacterium]
MDKDDNNKQDRLKNYLKFTTLAIQMGVLITAAALGGDWLDENQNNEFPVWTLVLTLVAIFASLFQVIREVSKMNRDD